MGDEGTVHTVTSFTHISALSSHFLCHFLILKHTCLRKGGLVKMLYLIFLSSLLEIEDKKRRYFSVKMNLSLRKRKPMLMTQATQNCAFLFCILRLRNLCTALQAGVHSLGVKLERHLPTVLSDGVSSQRPQLPTALITDGPGLLWSPGLLL